MTNDYKQIKNILNFIDSACLRIDLGWIITYANPQCSFLLGTSPEELIGKDLRETLPDVVSMFYKPLRHTLTSHESQHAEAIFGPTNKYLELFVNFYEDGILAVFRDITNRRHNEQLVQDASIRYRAIFDTVADALIIINNKGEITSFNAASERIFGYEAEEIIGHDISILLPENERQEHKGYIADSQIYESRIINRSRDLEGVRKDGTIFPLELNIAPMFLDNERGFIGILRDITERKKSEAEIMASKEKVEKASQAKTEFLRSMSHELRTPLNAILGFGQLLELQKGDISEKDTQEFINDIMQAGHNLLDLVNQVLNLSRIDTGQLHMQLEPVLLHNVVTECVTQINTSVAKKFKIQLINNINAPNLVVMADVQGIRQVLTNILTNAVKYNRSDGSVTIKSEPVDKDRIRILISDTGKGIAKNDIDKLFNPFERLSFRDGAIGGSGIGLTVAKQLVEAMKGTMGVTSIIDQGSTFWVELPLVLIEDL